MNDDQLRDTLRSIDAGTPVDWTSLTPTADDDRGQSTLESLDIVARVVAFHRSLHASAGIEATDGEASGRDAPGTTWGPLELLEHVGSGSFGDVFRARDRRLDRDVALKLLKRGANQSDPGVVHEGRQLARVRHPNVVAVYGADVVDGRAGLWMEFVNGRTLEAELRGGVTFSWRDSAAVGLAVCAALEAVHEAGLIHRDISARNVMRDEAGRTVVMDFGAARPIGDGVMSGTPLYLAPELLAGQPASRASDLYALGVLLYRLVSGVYPVMGEDLAAIGRAHRTSTSVPLRTRCPDLPPAFVEAVDTALDADPTRRFRDAGRFGLALAASLRATRPEGRWPLGRAVGAAAIGLGAVAASLLAIQRWEERPVPPARASSDTAREAASIVTRRVPLPDSPYPTRPSLDGRFVPFIGSDGNVNALEVATGTIRPLTSKRATTEFAYGTTAMSPDNRFVAYVWADGHRRSAVRVVDLDTGATRVVSPHDDGVDLQPVQWTGDGRAILAMGPKRGGVVQMAVIDAHGGRPRVLREVRFRPMGASISPDGRWLVYDRPEDDTARTRDIVLLDVATGRERPLVTGPSNELFPQWTPDGGAVLFASDRTTQFGLWAVRVDREAKASAPELIERDMGRMLPLGLTHDGSFYYFLKTDVVDVYTADLDPATRAIIGAPRLVNPGRMGSNVTSDWSADGRFLAYVSLRGYVTIDRFSRVLTIRDSQTGQERDLWPAMAFFLGPRWSPDGRRILVYGLGLDSGNGVYAIDVASGQTALVIGGPGIGEGEWSPDGRALLYRRGPSTIVVRDLASGTESVLLDLAPLGRRLIAGPGPASPAMRRTFQFSPDGQRLAVVTWTGDGDSAAAELVVREPDGRLLTLHRSRALALHGWTPDGNALWFTMPAEGSAQRPSIALWTIASTGGVPRPAALAMPGLSTVRPSPDGRQITFTAGFDGGEVRVAEQLLRRGWLGAPTAMPPR